MTHTQTSPSSPSSHWMCLLLAASWWKEDRREKEETTCFQLKNEQAELVHSACPIVITQRNRATVAGTQIQEIPLHHALQAATEQPSQRLRLEAEVCFHEVQIGKIVNRQCDILCRK